MSNFRVIRSLVIEKRTMERGKKEKKKRQKGRNNINWERGGGGNISHNIITYNKNLLVIITPVGIDRCVCPSLDLNTYSL